MKNLIFPIFLIILLFGCDSDSNLLKTNNVLIGRWKAEVNQQLIDSTGNIIQIYDSTGLSNNIIEIIEFSEQNNYDIHSPNVPFTFPILSKPNVAGSWELQESEGRIKLFSSSRDSVQIGDFVYYTKIKILTETKLEVEVYDRDNIFIHDRTFVKIE